MDTCNICCQNLTILSCAKCLQKGDLKCIHIPSACELHQDQYNIICQIHNELLDRYCCTCYQLICTSCVQDKHYSHNTLSIIDAITNLENIFGELTETQKNISSYVTACSDLRQKYHALERKISEEEKKYKEIISMVKSQLGLEIEKMKGQIEEQCQKNNGICPFLKLPNVSDERFPILYLSQMSQINLNLEEFQKNFMRYDISANELMYMQNIPHVFLSGITNLLAKFESSATSTTDLTEIDFLIRNLCISDEATTEYRWQQFVVPDNRIEELKFELDQLSLQNSELQKEEAFILQFVQSVPDIIRSINDTQTISEHCKLDDHHNLALHKFIRSMELLINANIITKNELIKSENDLKTLETNLDHVVKKATTDAQTQYNNDEPFEEEIYDWQKEALPMEYTQLEIVKLQTELENAYKINVSLEYEKERMKTEVISLHKELQIKSNLLEALQNEHGILITTIDGIHQLFCDITATNVGSLISPKPKKTKYLDILQSIMNHIIETNNKFMRDEGSTNDWVNQKDAMKSMLVEKDDVIRLLRKEKDDLQNRFSSIAGEKLTQGNPAIADLGDPNRPMKIGEKYGELYDNEWTDAMEWIPAAQLLFPNLQQTEIEELVVRHLCSILRCCYTECLIIAQEQLRSIVHIMQLDIDEKSTDLSSLPVCSDVTRIRRHNCAKFSNYLYRDKVLIKKLHSEDWDYSNKNDDLIRQLTETEFFQKCVHLCWSMVIQDPAMYLDENLIPDTAYNKSTYKEYTESGDKVKYVVWPALFLHKNGPLLYKGVVQAHK